MNKPVVTIDGDTGKVVAEIEKKEPVKPEITPEALAFIRAMILIGRLFTKR